MDRQSAFNKVKEVHDRLNEGGSKLEEILNKAALSLDESFHSAFLIDEATEKFYEAIIDGLDIKKRRDTLNEEIKDEDGTLIKELNRLKDGLSKEEEKQSNIDIPTKKDNLAGYNKASKEYNAIGVKIKKIEEEINELKEKINQKQKEYKALEIFEKGAYSGNIKKRSQEITKIKKAVKFFNQKTTVDHQSINIGEDGKPVDLKAIFKGTVDNFEFSFYDEKQNKKIRSDEPLTVSAVSSSGNPIQVTLKGIKIDPSTQTLTITDLKVDGDVSDAPLIIRDLYIRAMHQHSSGPMFYHDKKLSLNINNPVATFDLVAAYASVESTIDVQLDHTYDRNYKNIRKEVIFKLIESNNKTQFDKLSDKQKDDFVTNLVTTGYDIDDKPSFRKEYKDLTLSEGFKGTESQFKTQLLENIDKKSEEKLKKILEDRLDTKNIGSKTAKSSIIGNFITYFASTDVDKNKDRRKTQYDKINTRTGGQIDRQLVHIHATKYDEAKKAILLKLLEDSNKAVFDKLSDKQKDDFVTNLVTTGYDLDIPSFQTAFRDEITKDDFSGTEEEFEKQLLQNFSSKAEENLKKILEDRLDSSQISGQKSRSVIVGKALNFLNNTDMNLATRHATLGGIEGDLDRSFLQTRLRQEYENKFNKTQRAAFEKVLETNPEFEKLNQAQKDRLYERMQDLGTLANGAVTINLGKPVTAGDPDVTYDVGEIAFSPSTHDYRIMPNGENYDGFKVWLANQAPKDVLTDADKYRQRLRNGLVASLDDGETHYTTYFNDILKKFTDDAGVQTTLNQTLLEFINDTNEADHVDFDTRLDGMSDAMTPETTTSKRRYQRLAFWTQGEEQNRQSLAQGQSNQFQTESITAGGKTFSYSGEVAIKGAQSVTMSLTMKGGKTQMFTAGNPGALVRNLLTNPEIEPPHARFHAGLSVAKSVVKMIRGMGISLRTPITSDMMNTIPAYARTAIDRNANPMLEITEEDGKLVAKVFNLDLNTYRKENEYKLFDEQEFVASQSVRDLRQGVESLLVLTNQTMNSVYRQYRGVRFRSIMRPGLLKKPRRGGLRNMYKKLSFSGGSINVGDKSMRLDCKNGLFTFSGGDLKKPISGRNLGDLLAYNKELRGFELKTLQLANEKMLGMYQEKLKKQERHHNYGVIDEENHRVYVYDKHGNLGYYDSNDQTFVRRRRQYTSGRRYGRITDEHMPQRGFTVIKEGNNVVDQETYNNFLLNETLVGSMVRSMSRTHRAWTTWAPW